MMSQLKTLRTENSIQHKIKCRKEIPRFFTLKKNIPITKTSKQVFILKITGEIKQTKEQGKGAEIRELNVQPYKLVAAWNVLLCMAYCGKE